MSVERYFLDTNVLVYANDKGDPGRQAAAELQRLATVTVAVSIQKRYGISYWDALILAAAEAARCGVVYSEYLPGEQRYGEIVVRSPFVVSGE